MLFNITMFKKKTVFLRFKILLELFFNHFVQNTIFIFTPFSRVNVLFLFRLKNQFFGFCELTKHFSYKCIKKKSLCLKFYICNAKNRFQIGCGVPERIEKYAF
ncbi:hypothetical protein ACKWTF_009342 [Chironomus riparius]